MVTGKARAPYPGDLTNRLRRAHPDINAVRETLHHSPQNAGKNAPEIDTILIPAAHQPVRGALRALVLAAAFIGVLAVASPAGAASSCGRAVIDDWYDNGRVDGTYALHCYDDAIEILPRDVRDYSSAKDDIQRALQARKRGEPAPPASTDPTPGDDGGASGGSSGGSGGSGTPGAETSPTGATGDEGVEAGGAIDAETDSASSVPIPLLILAGLALLLVLAGSAGYVIRRIQARRIPPQTS
jgi:hypothetical protein